MTHAQERFYESGRWLGWDHFWQDVRYGLRMLCKSPGFTAIAVLTLALGVGANTAIFSILNAVLLHPLPYPQPDQLVGFQDDLPGVGSHDVGMSTPEWQDLKRSGIFEYVSPAWYDDNNLTGSSQPTRVRLLIVAPNYFALLGIKPQLGSGFDPEDPTPGFTLEAVISDGLWKRGFASEPHILGKSVRLDNDEYRITGVMPPGFHSAGRNSYDRTAEVWIAWGFGSGPFAGPQARNSHFPGAIARLKPGLTVAAAQSRVDALVASLQKQYPVDISAAKQMDGAIGAAQRNRGRQHSRVFVASAWRRGIGPADRLRERSTDLPAARTEGRSCEKNQLGEVMGVPKLREWSASSCKLQASRP